MKQLPDESIDLIVSDPPYQLDSTRVYPKGTKLEEISEQLQENVMENTAYGSLVKGFMNLEWDKLPSVEILKECNRVLKSGAFSFWLMTPRQDSLATFIIRLKKAGFDVNFTSLWWVYACLSEDTKILTENGLKGMNEIKTGDIVFGFNTSKNRLVKTRVNRKYVYDFNGKLFNLKNFDVDMLLTENHKILCKNGHHSGEKKWKEKKWKYVMAKDLKIHTSLEIPISAVYNGNKSIGEDLSSLLGWILSEGSIINKKGAGKNIRIYQSSTNLHYVNEIRSLLKKLKIPFKEYVRERKYKDRFYNEYQFFFTGEWFDKINKLIPNKKPTWKLLDLKYNERLKLFESLIKGDGSYKYCKNYPSSPPSLAFYQKDREFLRWFEALCITFGYRPIINFKKNVVGIKKRNTTQFQHYNYRPLWKKYKGKIWCINNDYGNFIAFRNNRYFITGNSGFPKSMSISLAIDKRECRKQLKEKLGREPTKEEFKDEWKKYREVIGKSKGHTGERVENHEGNFDDDNYEWEGEYDITKPTSSKAKEFENAYAGYQPKPATECIVVSMKPISEKSYTEQALKNGKGVTWLEDCRIPYQNEIPNVGGRPNHGRGEGYGFQPLGEEAEANPNGRFPANILVSGDALNDGTVSRGQQGATNGNEPSTHKRANVYGDYTGFGKATVPRGDEGSYSRYFSLDAWWKEHIKKLPSEVQRIFPFLITPKASASEKNEGLEKLPVKKMTFDTDKRTNKETADKFGGERKSFMQNIHPSVKPVELMSYLITLGSRINDIVLDPFAGSGTTAVACRILGRKSIGYELSKEYWEIAENRIKPFMEQRKIFES